MAHYYLTNMAINIPKILNPALDSIKTQIISANQICQAILMGPPQEYETKLRQKIESSSKLINQALQKTRLQEHKDMGLDTQFEYKPVPINEALMMIINDNKETLRDLFTEVLKGRMLVYYITYFPITSAKMNKRIP